MSTHEAQADGPEGARPSFSDLSAVYVNCTLKRPEQRSHTALLMETSAGIMRKNGVDVEMIRAAGHRIAFGVYPDMTEHGWEHDDWPALWSRIRCADILVIGTPIWLGEESSVCRLIIERLYAMSGELNDKGQSSFYGKCGGAVITGNEDGIKHCAMTILYALSHLGYTIPPQADCGWIGEVGPGPSYGDPVEGTDMPNGFDRDFTMKNTTFMTWNLLHAARALRDAGGIPAFGNIAAQWEDGERWGYPDPTR